MKQQTPLTGWDDHQILHLHVSESDTPRPPNARKNVNLSCVRTEAISFLSNRKYIYKTMVRLSNLVALNLC